MIMRLLDILKIENLTTADNILLFFYIIILKSYNEKHDRLLLWKGKSIYLFDARHSVL